MIVPFKNRHVLRVMCPWFSAAGTCFWQRLHLSWNEGSEGASIMDATGPAVAIYYPLGTHIIQSSYLYELGKYFLGNMMKYDEKLFCSPLMIYFDGADGAEEEPEGLEKALDVLAWVSGSIRCHHWNYASRLSSRACYEVWQDPVMAPHCRHSKACRRLDCRAKWNEKWLICMYMLYMYVHTYVPRHMYVYICIYIIRAHIYCVYIYIYMAVYTAVIPKRPSSILNFRYVVYHGGEWARAPSMNVYWVFWFVVNWEWFILGFTTLTASGKWSKIHANPSSFSHDVSAKMTPAKWYTHIYTIIIYYIPVYTRMLNTVQ